MRNRQDAPEGISYEWDGQDPWQDGWQDTDRISYENSSGWDDTGAVTWDETGSTGWEESDPSAWNSDDSGQDGYFPMEDDEFEFMDLDDGWESEAPSGKPVKATPGFTAGPLRSRRQSKAGNRRRSRGNSPEKKVKLQHMIILIGLIVIFIVSGSFFIADLREYKTAENEYAKITESTIKLPDKNAEPAKVEVDGEEYEIPFEFPDLIIDFDKLEATNADFVGVLHLPALDLTYPVAHSRDNSEYLSRTFEGTRNSSGCIFMDMYAKEDLSDSNTFVFGHNMKNQTMFGSLKRFSSEKGLCDKHPYIYFFTPGKVYKYRIFSYFPTPVDSYIYNGYTGEDGYDEYIQKSLRDSQYKEADLSEIDFTEYPNLMTLSTCFGTQHTHNFIVQGALVATLDLPDGNSASGSDSSAEAGE